MNKVKYYYDPDTLSYRKIDPKKSTKYLKVFFFLLGSGLFGLLGLIVLLNANFIVTPKELLLEREVSNYELQFEILNKKMEQMEEVLADIEERDNDIYRIYFAASPIPKDIRKTGFGGVNRHKGLEGFKSSDTVIKTTKRLEQLQKRMVIQSKSLDEIVKLASEKEKLLQSIPAIQPVQNKDLKRLASGFGWRTDPFTKARKMHKGMDFTAPRMTPIYATGNGVVQRADSRSTGYGKHIRIDHGFGYVTLYAHLSKYNVSRGQKVKRGDLIGFVGSTGRSQAPHLHYEIIKDGRRINPINFYYGSLTTEEFENMLRLSQRVNQSMD